MAIISNPVPNLSIGLRVLSRLLAYPNSDLRNDLPDMRAALHADGALTAGRKEELYALIRKLETSDPLRNESEFVELFDRGRATSLHLFEHVHGDSRDRGPAMIDLAQTYEKAGLYLAPGELPDYLPVMLEFVSTQTPQIARSFLGEMAHLLNAIFNALQQRKSPYASVLGAGWNSRASRRTRSRSSPTKPSTWPGKSLWYLTAVRRRVKANLAKRKQSTLSETKRPA